MSKRKPIAPKLSPLQRWGPVVLGTLFVVAGGSKLLDPWTFYTALPGYGISGPIRSLVAALVPAIEVVLGVALMARWGVRQTSMVAGGFLTLFMVAIAAGWSMGTLDECGCFGALLERSPGEALAIDALFLALAVAVWRGVGADGGPLEGWHKALMGAMAVVGVGITLSLLQTGPSGVRAAMAAAPSPEMRSVDLSTGEHLLYLFHHECPHCAEMSPRVAEYTRDAALPPVVGFTFLTSQRQIDAYRDKYDLRIPVQNLQGNQFTRITGEGSVPQLVFVRDGEIVTHWLGLLPAATELSGLLGSSP